MGDDGGGAFFKCFCIGLYWFGGYRGRIVVPVICEGADGGMVVGCGFGRGGERSTEDLIYIQRPYLEDSLAFFVSFRLVGSNSCFVSSLSVCLLDENGREKTSVISLYGVPYRQNSSVSACVTPIEHRTLVVAVVYATSILYQTFTSTLNSPHSPPNPLTNQPSHHLLIPIPITHPPLSLSFSLSPDSLFQNTPPPNFSF